MRLATGGLCAQTASSKASWGVLPDVFRVDVRRLPDGCWSVRSGDAVPVQGVTLSSAIAEALTSLAKAGGAR